MENRSIEKDQSALLDASGDEYSIGMTTTHFIAMNKQNLEKYKQIITPLGNETLIVCDIDNTLYHPSAGVEDLIDKKLVEYLTTVTSSQEEALACKNRYDDVYGLTVYGALAELDVELDFYSKYITKTINYEEYLKKDPVLRDVLNRLDCRKICLTNGDTIQAKGILDALGLTECFEAVVTIDAAVPFFIHKPTKESYQFVDELFGVSSPKNVLFFDDNIKNIEQALAHNWIAHHVQGNIHIGDMIGKAAEMLYMRTDRLLQDNDEVEVKEN
ncbi:Haloacid dehalogenase-like hydrolase [Trachipleistophora hominis]|uniref:Haloacid dehalogenase-like hydrolase n=1 Tax=Trachipleistophora hominis TaxID=72359 RepID=L7JU28_TRAHO|nr:Haloacid dehalogenase-like hydrolase [Trachipleistophora hominis]